MGCTPSIGPPAAIKPAENGEINNDSIFTADEKLKLKEVWVTVKQNNMKKLGDDIMDRALKKSSTLLVYWQNFANLDPSNNLTFSENESVINTDAIARQVYSQHGYKILDKIDQLIMTMVGRTATANNNDTALNESFRRVAESHLEYKISQNHVDVICESFLESLKNLMYQNGHEWTIKHELTWTKLFTLTTNKFLSSIPSSTTKKTIS
ncbi:unnamed protein product [Adineta steineri]|uniref:Globin family profile domain-containing protein n=1 Tax=Adineta steineri TaxID=433720 RepID=A0A818SCG9_9BILA|nr:unnamed protein product [Adineta steineri]CAF0732811.1 unnamed protein product [Adineta steineri]CAF3667084.1 unnamed protein product [Adineta steineri]CAF3797870.1 unnamed protein product [Adineta steineri]